MCNTKNLKSTLMGCLLVMVLSLCGFSDLAQAGDKQNVKTITVTVEQKGKAIIPALTQDDFFVYENGVKQRVVSVSAAKNENSPLNLAVVIQEGLPQVNSELKVLKSFIQNLPSGSQVMVAYINGSFVDVRQSFTTDLVKAAQRLRVVNNSTIPASPYLALVDVMKKFNGMDYGRNQILFISSGLDPLVEARELPTSNLYLGKAIKAAQQENITIFSLFAPQANVRRSFVINSGQNALNYLSEQTGGNAFIMGTGFVTFDAPLNQLDKLLDQQYVITYIRDSESKDFNKVKVTTDDSNINVSAIKGYKAK